MLGQGNDPSTATEETINQALDTDRAGHQRRPDPPLHRQRLPAGHRERELRRLHRLVGRHRPVAEPRRPLRLPRGGGDVVVRHDGHPDRRAQRRRRGEVDGLRLRPGQRGPDHGLRAVRVAGASACGTSWSSSAATPPRWPTARCCSRTTRTKARLHVFADLPDGARPADHRPLRHDHGRLSDGRRRHRRPHPAQGPVRAVPDVAARRCCASTCSSSSRSSRCSRSPCRCASRAAARTSTSAGSGATSPRRSPTSATQLWRAFAYAGVATVLCVLIAYPIAYFIAFKAGQVGEPAARAGDGAVLHELPAAHDRLAVAVRRQRPDPRHRRRAAPRPASPTPCTSRPTARS